MIDDQLRADIEGAQRALQAAHQHEAEAANRLIQSWKVTVQAFNEAIDEHRKLGLSRNDVESSLRKLVTDQAPRLLTAMTGEPDAT